MKKDLIKICDSIDDIERLFHRDYTPGFPEFEKIYDVQEFQDWLQELKYELQGIFDRTHDQYILETINSCNSNMNGVRDKKVFREIVAKIKPIRNNIDKYYEDERVSTDDTVNTNMSKKPLIFISHSSKNKKQVEKFVDLLRAINLQPERDIFCSSIPGYGIPINSGKTILDYLRDLFNQYNVHVIFIHSHEYYNSAISLNEMGAAWVLKNKQTSILLPGFDYSDMTGAINGTSISIKLDSDEAIIKDLLNQLRHDLEEEFELQHIPDAVWEKARDKFLLEINSDKV